MTHPKPALRFRIGERVHHKRTGDTGTVERLGGEIILWVRWDATGYRGVDARDVTTAKAVVR